MTTRYDVSDVPLQGAYVAKQCPVRAQNDALLPAEPAPTPAMLQQLFDKGNDFERGVVAEMREFVAGCVFIEEHGEEAEAATLSAMRNGAPAILGSRLPADYVGRRVGRPDLLVLAEGHGYRPVDIKFHGAIAPESPARQGFPAILSILGTPWLEASSTDPELSAHKRGSDLFQLAHYQRMLEASGLAPADGRWGGIIGTERRIVWYDLDLAIWRTPSISQGTKLRSTMERYDFEFAFRLDIIAVARRAKTSLDVKPLVVPVRIGECTSCPWWDHCRLELEKPPGDVSLLPRIGWNEWKIHRDHGVTNRAELAALDPLTARIVSVGIDVTGMQGAVANMSPEAVLCDLAEFSPDEAQLERLQREGVETVADLVALDPATASYVGSGPWALPEQIDQARAAMGPAPVYRRRGISEVHTPRAHIEVDVDMENSWDGCYLWGALVTDRSGMDIGPSGYRAFATWDPMSPAAEAQNSLTFWRWLMRLRTAAHDADVTFAAYCWNAPAENTYLRRLGIAAGIEKAVEEFIASSEWIDLLPVWNGQLITGGPSGLKAVAPLVGFDWAVDVPGGAESMGQYAVAVADGEDSAAARSWLLAYNQSDVTATFAIRQWMATETVPAIEDWRKCAEPPKDKRQAP